LFDKNKPRFFFFFSPSSHPTHSSRTQDQKKKKKKKGTSTYINLQTVFLLDQLQEGYLIDQQCLERKVEERQLL